jgi:hypothetical protein
MTSPDIEAAEQFLAADARVLERRGHATVEALRTLRAHGRC